MTEWFERDGRLADGTPLRDVAAEMPVEVRDAGTLDWRAGVVISDQCTCGDDRDGYRFNEPTQSIVHERCGKPRDGGPTVESVIAFIDGILEKRRRA